jgi:hypothetical protein
MVKAPEIELYRSTDKSEVRAIGNEVFKTGEHLDLQTAKKIVASLRLAKIALQNRGIKVVVPKIMTEQELQKHPQGESIKLWPDTVALVSRRIRMDEISRRANRIGWDAKDRQAHEKRLPDGIFGEIRGALKAAGLQIIDDDSSNIIVTPWGRKVLIEAIWDKTGGIEGKPDLSKFTPEIAKRIERLHRQIIKQGQL